MKQILFAAFAILGGAASAWAGANPQLLALLPPDAKVIAGIDFAHAKSSPFGKFLLEQANPASDLDSLKATTGFDPRTDLLEFVVGGTDRGNLVGVGFGAFPIARLTTMAELSGVPAATYRGVILISLDNGPKALSRANMAGFLDGSTVVIGTHDQVVEAIDRWSSGGVRGNLVQKASEAGASSDAWAVATGLNLIPGMGEPATEAPENSQQAAITKNITSKIEMISTSLIFNTSDVTAKGQLVAKTAQDAQELAAVFQLFMAMTGPNADQSPMFSGMQVAPSGQTVNFSLKLTEQQAEDLVKPKLPANRTKDDPFVLE